MEESAPKRRRVSPQTSAGASGGGATPQSPEASSSRRKRPSFASPTKASLARHNPQILERRRSASPSKPASSRPAARRPSIAGSEQSLSDLLTARPITTAENVPASELGREEDEMLQSEAGPSSGRSVRRIRGGLAAAPRRSPAKPNPRPLPPPAPEGDDELNPFIGHTLRRSPITGVSIPPPPEPELPPAVPDAVSSTPPRGIHSSPLRWRGRDKVKKSSPLKPQPERPPSAEPSKKPGLAPRALPRAGEGPSEPLRDVDLNTTTNHARMVKVFDPNEAKKRERDTLRAEIVRLRSDLGTADKENERLRLMQASGQTVAPTNEDGVLDLIQRALISSDETPRPAPSHQMVQAVLNPMGLLPFGRSSLITSSLTDDPEDMEIIKSHHPVSMNADEELPYLQLFSPFSVTSSIAVLPPLPNQPLRQRRLVTLRSRDLPGLFTAKLEMVVNAMNLGILELSVASLEPSAKYELGPFVDKICSGKCNRTMQRNVGILTWAMGEWYRVAVQRARFWSRLEEQLGSREQLLESVAETRTRRRQQKDARPEQDEKTSTLRDRADLIRFLGLQSYDVNVPVPPGSSNEPSLRLEWKIGFDWTGEAQSSVAILVGVPGSWREADQRGIFGKFPKLFEDLIEGGQDPEVAVGTVVALLAGG
ncbi:Uncharacterized protein TPAR_07626 [Tolypocladium paradoxum]|uniref:Uncharacterized protein n=1 Tax=Tolypocladium paradoxum TaxID=94208 RepID=A0A2S4KPR5_9HYPO|nr:Uncharacterized protein TPAR_07626 [Tolypocladium paradoxum]